MKIDPDLSPAGESVTFNQYAFAIYLSAHRFAPIEALDATF
jgi:hypothetical protein